jgi:hypothetical protein
LRLDAATLRLKLMSETSKIRRYGHYCPAVELLLRLQNLCWNLGKIDVSKEGNCTRATIEMNHSVVSAAYGPEFFSLISNLPCVAQVPSFTSFRSYVTF